MSLQTEQYTGVNASGSDGQNNRKITLSNSTLTEQDGFLVFVDGLSLQLTIDYSVTHSASSSIVTFLNALFDSQLITIQYLDSVISQTLNFIQVPSGTDLSDKFGLAFANLLSQAGRPLRVRYYTETIGSVWDDERTLIQSGNSIYTSGIMFKIDSRRIGVFNKGSEDAVLIEQGRIRYDDSKIYVSGNLPTTSGAMVCTIAISGASTVERVYEQIFEGANVPQVNGVDIYKKLYLRQLSTGSLT